MDDPWTKPLNKFADTEPELELPGAPCDLGCGSQASIRVKLEKRKGRQPNHSWCGPRACAPAGVSEYRRAARVSLQYGQMEKGAPKPRGRNWPSESAPAFVKTEAQRKRGDAKVCLVGLPAAVFPALLSVFTVLCRRTVRRKARALCL